MSVSLNVLGYTVRDSGALLTWLNAARPPYTVVMDDVALAAQVAATGTQVVFRRYRGDDAELPSTTTPADFLASVNDVPAGWIVQAGNEPNGDQAQLVTWTVDLMTLANRAGRRLAVGSWSVGNPDDERVAAGGYDALLKALAGSRHVLSVHEYFHDNPLTEPWHVGRYRAFLRRSVALGIQTPDVVITEHGRDLGGGAGDGWRGQGWSEAEYAGRLEAAQTVYRADNVCACVFGYGRGFDDRWQSFNVEGAPDLLARMTAMNAQEDEMAGPAGWARVTTNAAGARVNVRAGANLTATAFAVVQTGDWVKPTGAPVLAAGHRWQRVVLEDCRVGYVSLNVLTLGEVTG